MFITDLHVLIITYYDIIYCLLFYLFIALYLISMCIIMIIFMLP